MIDREEENVEKAELTCESCTYFADGESGSLCLCSPPYPDLVAPCRPDRIACRFHPDRKLQQVNRQMDFTLTRLPALYEYFTEMTQQGLPDAPVVTMVPHTAEGKQEDDK